MTNEIITAIDRIGAPEVKKIVMYEILKIAEEREKDGGTNYWIKYSFDIDADLLPGSRERSRNAIKFLTREILAADYYSQFQGKPWHVSLTDDGYLYTTRTRSGDAIITLRGGVPGENNGDTLDEYEKWLEVWDRYFTHLAYEIAEYYIELVLDYYAVQKQKAKQKEPDTAVC